MGRRGLPVSVAALAVCAGLGLLGPSAGSASWDQVQVKVVTIHYKTHDGYRRAAYVVLPDWYGPGNNPPLPLIISPHGRGVSAEENVDRWGNLPTLGSVRSRESGGTGPQVQALLLGLRRSDRGPRPDAADPSAARFRGCESNRRASTRSARAWAARRRLLLAARHPRLLAGAAAFDPVTDMARRYRDFARLPCNRGCLRKWGDPLGFGLRKLARDEIGGTRAALRARMRAAARSPTRARSRARECRSSSGGAGPTASSDRPDQSVPLARKLRRLNPDAPLHTVVGLVAALRGHAPVLHAHSRVEEVRPAGHSQACLAAGCAVSASATSCCPGIAPCATHREGCCPGIGRRQGSATTASCASAGGSSSSASRAIRAPARRSISTMRSSTARRFAARLLAAQPGVPQRDVRRLARVVVPVLG